MMKSKFIIAGIIILVIITIFIFSLIQKEPNLKNMCCNECRDAFNQIPTKGGPEITPCGTFTTGYDWSSECKTYFEKNPMTVSECD